MTEKIVLGFDYGTRRIGVAVGQSVTATASPLEIVRSVKNRPGWSRIEILIGQWRPEALVVGLPLDVCGEQQEMTEPCLRFARRMQGRFHLPTYRIDERLSSHEARARLQSSYDVDAVAAQVILETWFSQQRAAKN